MKSQQDPARHLEFIELANAMPQMIWISMPDGTVIYFNERIRDYAGVYRKDDDNWQWYDLVHGL